MPLASVSLLGRIALDRFISRWCGGYCQPSIRFSHPQVIVPCACFSYLYTSCIRSRFPCRVNSGGHVKRSKYIDTHAVFYRKAILFGMYRLIPFTPIFTENQELSTC